MDATDVCVRERERERERMIKAKQKRFPSNSEYWTELKREKKKQSDRNSSSI